MKGGLFFSSAVENAGDYAFVKGVTVGRLDKNVFLPPSPSTSIRLEDKYIFWNVEVRLSVRSGLDECALFDILLILLEFQSNKEYPRSCFASYKSLSRLTSTTVFLSRTLPKRLQYPLSRNTCSKACDRVGSWHGSRFTLIVLDD